MSAPAPAMPRHARTCCSAAYRSGCRSAAAVAGSPRWPRPPSRSRPSGSVASRSRQSAPVRPQPRPPRPHPPRPHPPRPHTTATNHARTDPVPRVRDTAPGCSPLATPALQTAQFHLAFTPPSLDLVFFLRCARTAGVQGNPERTPDFLGPRLQFHDDDDGDAGQPDDHLRRQGRRGEFADVHPDECGVGQVRDGGGQQGRPGGLRVPAAPGHAAPAGAAPPDRTARTIPTSSGPTPPTRVPR